jgi:hypothetical protein
VPRDRHELCLVQRGDGGKHSRFQGLYGSDTMRGIFKGLLAGWGASKLGGGCISTIIIFIILYWLLGKL